MEYCMFAYDNKPQIYTNYLNSNAIKFWYLNKMSSIEIFLPLPSPFLSLFSFPQAFAIQFILSFVLKFTEFGNSFNRI